MLPIMKIKLNLLYLVLSSLFFLGCSAGQGDKPVDPENILHYVVDESTTWKKEWPVVFLLHGYGGNSSQKLNLKNRLSRYYNYVSIEAPYKIGERSYAWFDLEFVDGQASNFDLEELKTSRFKLRETIRFFKQQHDLSSDEIITLGFSQGATMGLELAIEYPDCVSGVVALSGMLGWERSPGNSVKSEVCGVEIFQAHGTKDKVVTLPDAERVKDYFTNCQSYKYETYNMGHEIKPKLFGDIRRWMNRRLKDQGYKKEDFN